MARFFLRFMSCFLMTAPLFAMDELDIELACMVCAELETKDLLTATLISRKWWEPSRDALCTKHVHASLMLGRKTDECAAAFFTRMVLPSVKVYYMRTLFSLERKQIIDFVHAYDHMEKSIIYRLETLALKTAARLEIDTPTKLICFLRGYYGLVFNGKAAEFLKLDTSKYFKHQDWRGARDLFGVALEAMLEQDDNANLDVALESIDKYIWGPRLKTIMRNIEDYRLLRETALHQLFPCEPHFKKANGQSWPRSTLKCAKKFARDITLKKAKKLNRHARVEKTPNEPMDDFLVKLKYLLVYVHTVSDFEENLENVYRRCFNTIGKNSFYDYEKIEEGFVRNVWRMESDNEYLSSLKRMIERLSPMPNSYQNPRYFEHEI